MKLGKLRHESKYLAIRYFYTKKNWSIEWMCRQLEISRAAYYKWLHREIPYEELENIRLPKPLNDIPGGTSKSVRIRVIFTKICNNKMLVISMAATVNR